MALWSNVFGSALSSAGNSAGSSLGSSFAASARAYGRSNWTWADPLGHVGAGLWTDAQDAQDAYNDQRQRDQYSWQKSTDYQYYLKSLQDTPSASVKGYEAAGLNPILVANSSAGSFSGSSALHVQDSQSNRSNGQAPSGLLLDAQRASIDSMRADVKLKAAQATATLMDAETHRLQQSTSAESAVYEREKLKQEAMLTASTLGLSDQKLNYYMSHPDEYEDYLKHQLSDPHFQQTIKKIETTLRGVNSVTGAVGASVGYKKFGEILRLLKSKGLTK